MQGVSELLNTKKIGANAQSVTQRITDFPVGTESSAREIIAEHVKRFGTTASGRTVTFDKVVCEQTAHHAEQAKFKASRVLVDEAHRAPYLSAESIQTVKDTRIKN
ncbi:hypothetical protein F2S72_09365 [Pseudomonas syringae pv. actinidiae]|nr:hypothetical protein [Pseudomonas syringae pv. actinidiae]